MEPKPLPALRRGMLALVALGAAGLLVELVGLEHYSDANQMIPLVVASAGLLSVGWMAALPGLFALRALQFIMLVFVGTGVTGITMHADIARETGDEVVREGKTVAEIDAEKIDEAVAPPLLAPGLFVQLGLLGLLATLAHPVAEPREGEGTR